VEDLTLTHSLAGLGPYSLTLDWPEKMADTNTPAYFSATLLMNGALLLQ
jgi:hypothetical protein